MSVPRSETSLRNKISLLDGELAKVKRWREEDRRKWESEKRRLEEQINVLRHQKRELERENGRLKQGKQT